jgi:peptide/nickel transport system permease protein
MASAIRVERRGGAAQDETSQSALVWKRFRKHRLGLIGLIALTLLTLAVIVVPVILPFTYEDIDDGALEIVNGTAFKPAMWVSPAKIKTFIDDNPATPQDESVRDNPFGGHIHILGTNELGRDNLARLFYAGRISLAVGLITTLITVFLGAMVGALAGFYGGWIDTMLMRLVDLLLSLPPLPILLVLSTGLSRSGIMDGIFGEGIGTIATIILALSLLGWLGVSRLVRGSILSLRGLDFVEATRALGASNRRIIMRHMMPNSFAPIIVAATLSIGGFIVDEAGLSFLGLGIQSPTPSWGNIMENSREYMGLITTLNPLEEIRGYMIILPGILLLVTVLSINFIGDALRDALDPRLKT